MPRRQSRIPRDRPADLDEAWLHVPWKEAGEARVWGEGGPTLFLGANRLGRWDGKVWIEAPPVDAPWRNAAVVDRLVGGATVIAPYSPERGKDVFYYLPKVGDVLTITLPGDDKIVRARFVELDDVLWIAADTDDKTILFAPVDPASMTLPPVSASAPSGAGSASASELDHMPAPTKIGDACATPFVLLATPPTTNYAYDLTRAAMVGHGELQDELVFVEYVRDGQVYFGAQAKTRDVVEKLVGIIKAEIPAMKPQLWCLDAASHVPGAAAPAKGARRVKINLKTGELLE